MVRPGSDIRDSQDAVLLSVLLQTSADVAVSVAACFVIVGSGRSSVVDTLSRFDIE